MGKWNERHILLKVMCETNCYTLFHRGVAISVSKEIVELLSVALCSAFDVA